MINDNDYDKLIQFIRKKSGLHFSDEKKYFVLNKLKRRMEVCNSLSLNDYLNLLYRDYKGHEVDALVDELTVNETYFFRNKPQLETFSKHVLPMLLDLKRKNSRREIRIWSAGCSIGCEPYTLALIILDRVKDLSCWDMEIFGTDISESALDVARKGLYTERELKDIPSSMKLKYFAKGEKYYHISDEIKKMVKFSYLNLVDEADMRSMYNIDVLFCRNVLIYFDNRVQREIMGRFYDSMSPGSFIFLGHTESMSRMSKAFKSLKIGNDFVYIK